MQHDKADSPSAFRTLHCGRTEGQGEKMEEKKNFAEWLSNHLKEKKLKKKDFAEALHTTPQTVSRWCNGVVIPDEATVKLIKMELGLYDDRMAILEKFTTQELLAEIERRCGK